MLDRYHIKNFMKHILEIKYGILGAFVKMAFAKTAFTFICKNGKRMV